MSEPGAASSSNASESSFSSPSSLPPISYDGVPQEFLYRITEYSSLPRCPEWREKHKHSDLPCVFRQSKSYLWSPEQQAELHDLFYPARAERPAWRNDPGSPILSIIGRLRYSSMDQAEYDTYPGTAEEASKQTGIACNPDRAGYKVGHTRTRPRTATRLA